MCWDPIYENLCLCLRAVVLDVSLFWRGPSSSTLTGVLKTFRITNHVSFLHVSPEKAPAGKETKVAQKIRAYGNETTNEIAAWDSNGHCLGLGQENQIKHDQTFL